MNNLITIGKLSKISGVSTRTIRHYENIGLLKSALIKETNYRMYGEYEIKRLEQILLLRSFGFSLSDILTILTSSENETVAGIFNNKIDNLDKNISQLCRSKEILVAITKIYKNHGLEYINNFYLMKEMVYMNSVFTRLFNGLELKVQVKLIKELYRTGSISPETLKEIGTESGQQLLNELHMSLVKTLLNNSEKEVEKNIIIALGEEDPELRDEIIKALFTFDDFGKLPECIIKKWLDKSDDMDLVISLKESSYYLKEKILKAMNSERAERIRSEIDKLKTPTLDESYSAMSRLISVLRKIEADGEIVIERF